MRYVFIETSLFSRHREECFDDDSDFSEFQKELMANPSHWPVIPGGSPLRKARWRDDRSGRGKRGGIRIIYMQVPEIQVIVLFDVYPKTRKSELSRSDFAHLSGLAKEIRRLLLARKDKLV